MRLHELNAGTLHPPHAERDWGAPFFVCRCPVVELDDRVIVVDTGIGRQDIARPAERLGDDWIAMARPALDPAEVLTEQLPGLGITSDAVTDVIVTHGHRDHVGGLADLPHARVHAHPGLRRLVERARAGEAAWPSPPAQWSHGVRWAPDPRAEGEWKSLPTLALDGVPSSVRMVELPGHAIGHCGVVVLLDDGAHLLHVGDAAFHPAQYTHGSVPPGVELFVEMTQFDHEARVETEQRLTALARDPHVHVRTAHGPLE